MSSNIFQSIESELIRFQLINFKRTIYSRFSIGLYPMTQAEHQHLTFLYNSKYAINRWQKIALLLCVLLQPVYGKDMSSDTAFDI